MELNEFTAETLQPYVGSTFRFEIDGQTIELVLNEVKTLMEKHVSPKMKRDAFSLYFTGPQNLYIKQGPYPATHEALGGPWTIFIVPLGRKGGGSSFEYEAVFT